MGLKLELDLPDELAAELQHSADLQMRSLHDLCVKELHHYIYGHLPAGKRATDEEVAAFRAEREASRRITIPAKQRNRIFERCEGRCAYCDGTISYSEPFHIDHIMPLSKGGTNAESNLTLSCVACNVRKGAKALV